MEEEISLREIIETLLRGKSIIAAITIIAVLLSGVFSFFILPPTYQAAATLIINEPNIQNVSSDSLVSVMLESLSQYPLFKMETIRTQVKNPQVLQKVIDKMDATEGMTPEGLARKINANIIRDTRLLEISVTDRDSDRAAEIANILSQEFIRFLNEQTKQSMNQSVTFLRGQMDVENEKLERSTNELKEFLTHPPGIDELKQDIAANLSLLTSFKTTVINKELQLEQARAVLASVLRELESTPKVLTVKKSVIDDPLLSGIIKDSDNMDTSELAKITLETEEINPVYITLTDRVSTERINISHIETEVRGLQREINNIKSNLESLQIQYADKKIMHEQLEQKVDTRRETYQAFARKYEEIRIAATAEMGDNTVTIVSPAQVPQNPIAPNKTLNLAIATALGLMVGVFAVFFREYWKSSDVVFQESNK